MMASTRNPDRTRRAILDAAAVEFCAAGLAGARIDAIAVAAGVNKRMLYHYFVNKEGLFEAVLTERLGTPAQDGDTASLSERLAAAQRRIADDPDQIRLLMWEALECAGRELVAVTERTEAWRTRIATIRTAQQSGRLRGDVDAAQLELALAALVVFPSAFPQLALLITGHTATEPGFREAHSALLDLFAMFLENPLPAATPESAKPRYRLAATVTESAARSGRE